MFKRISELIEENKVPFAVCTVVQTKGSCPRKSGRMIVFEGGKTEGTIGGGPAEWQVIAEAQRLIALEQSALLDFILDKSQPEGLEMTCGGQMKVHVESFIPRPRLFLIGAGHVNQAVYRLAEPLGFELYVVDDRLEAEHNPAFAEAKAIIVSKTIAQAVSEASVFMRPQDYVIIATKDNDEAALRALLFKDCRYIGLIGSKRKCRLIEGQLAVDEAALLWLKQIHMPIGLDLGGQTPEEIAISIMAELLAAKYDKTAQPLSRRKPLVLIRGAGDLATGVAVRLHRSGFVVVMSEIDRPTCIRHSVSFAAAVYKGSHEVEGVCAQYCSQLKEVVDAVTAGKVAVVTQNEAMLYQLKPKVFIEATLRKVPVDITPAMAPLTIGLGPGFIAGQDVHAVIETNRGHYLGQVIWQGAAEPNTGVPGNIGGFAEERVVRAPGAGRFVPTTAIGQKLASGDEIGYLEPNTPSQSAPQVIRSSIAGVLRGILYEAMIVDEGFKIADIDPRAELAHCFSVSDKARAIAGGALEAICQGLELDLSR